METWSARSASGMKGSPRPFKLAVASGKGGTGKTLVATNLAAAAAASGLTVTLVDCDVDAPNDHLFLERTDEQTMVVEASIAEPDETACTGCGACRRVCAFGAARVLGGRAFVFEELCHGCELCVRQCPTGAMRMVKHRVGDMVDGASKRDSRLHVVTGRLDVGQVKAAHTIRATRSMAESRPADLVVLDAPPGVACSAVVSARGADALLLVTEPTPFGLHDLELSMELGRALGLQMAVVVNREGTGTAQIAEALESWYVPIVARIPFDRQIAEVYARGALVIDELPEHRGWLDGVFAWIEDVRSNMGQGREGAA